jgi:preprotein translocase SecF subunit
MPILSSLRSGLSHTKIDFMRVHKLALFMSVFCIVASLILVFFKGLNFGIDFAGGILIEARIDKNLDVARVRELITAEVKDVQIQNVDQKDLLIRVAKTDEEQSVIVKKIQEILNKNFGNVEYRKVDYVGPQVGSELIWKGFMALLLSFVFLMIYIWIRFDWQFGLGGIFALIHDAVLTLGFYSLSGLEFNLTSIAAILTVIGYSINDSVVIYDRIRENLRRYKKMDLADLINSSTNSTLSRTVLTSGVTLFSILALMIFGGEVLKSFSVATFFGIVIGTYSSIYISAPILIYLDPRKEEK